MLLECRLDFLDRQMNHYFRLLENVDQTILDIGIESTEHGKVLIDLIREARLITNCRATRPASRKSENSRYYNLSYDENLRKLQMAGEQEYQRACRLADETFISMFLNAETS